VVEPIEGHNVASMATVGGDNGRTQAHVNADGWAGDLGYGGQ
jgi:hypothetical protein